MSKLSNQSPTKSTKGLLVVLLMIVSNLVHYSRMTLAIISLQFRTGVCAVPLVVLGIVLRLVVDLVGPSDTLSSADEQLVTWIGI